jgi:hypothetical protein
MAWVYLKLRNDTQGMNPSRSHIVLPPSAIDGALGAGTVYWQEFYDGVKYGVSEFSPPQSGINPANVKVIHIHDYAPHPAIERNNQLNLYNIPLHGVAWSVNTIRRGIDWFRNRYPEPAPNAGKLLADVLISEMGLNWMGKGAVYFDDKLWAGYYNNFRDGLAWWNSWLCWLTRLAPSVLNLQNPTTSGGNTVYGCIHEPDVLPYVLRSAPTYARGQYFFDCDTWAAAYHPAMSAFQVSELQNNIGAQGYQDSFTCNTKSTNTFRNIPVLWPRANRINCRAEIGVGGERLNDRRSIVGELGTEFCF